LFAKNLGVIRIICAIRVIYPNADDADGFVYKKHPRNALYPRNPRYAMNSNNKELT